MITSDNLATLTIRQIIFHDIPRHLKGSGEPPTLADSVTEIDRRRSGMLKERLTRALASKSAYPVQFDEGTGSPVPQEIQAFTQKAHTAAQFVAMSQRMAKYLHEQQGGAMSAGLLCVVDVTSSGSAGIIALKLERETGAQLTLDKKDGKRRFAMSVLDDLVLTDGTRLFKAAIFVRSGKEKFAATVCDGQNSVHQSNDVAAFWMRFLGCTFLVQPRVATQRWFDATVTFMNDYVTDPIVKNDIYEHLVSELKSNRSVVAPRKFIEECMPEDMQTQYTGFLQNNGISLSQFRKDIGDIKGKLRRRAYHTARGVTVTSPAEETDLIDVRPDEIVVKDQLKSVATK